MIPNINGIPVHILEPLKIKIKRTWKERLFTRPFKPFQKFNHNLVDVLEDDKVLQKADGLFMNAKTWDKWCKAMENRNDCS